jgi:DUF1680 family protein
MNARNPVSVASVKVSGALDQRIRLGLRHLLQERDRILGGEGHTQGWGADQVGRWVTAVSEAAACTSEHIPELDQTVREMIAVQAADGSWGEGRSWVHWGNSRAMVGLSKYYELTGDGETLAALRRIGDYYVRACESASDVPFYPRGAIEGLMAVWRNTGADVYRRTAEKAAICAIESGALLDPGAHMHCDVLTPLGGMVELFLATGKQQYLTPVQGLYEEILREKMWITGGISENRDNRYEARDETCQVSDWVRLSLKLWQATGKPSYVDVAEHTLLNHLYFNQDHGGGFCAARYISPVSAASRLVRDFVAWICCSMHGLWALTECARFIYTHSQDTVDINLYTSCEGSIHLSGGNVILKQSTSYPSNCAVRVTVFPERDRAFCVRARIPHWAGGCQVALNGNHMVPERADGYVQMDRTWRSGDTVELDFEPKLAIVQRGSNGFAPAGQERPLAGNPGPVDGAALVNGPLVLMVDPVLNPHEMYEWDEMEVLVPRLENGDLFLPKVEALVPGRGQFSVPEMCFMTLGRPLRADESAKDSLDGPSGAGSTRVGSELQDPMDSTWKLVFLVPVSEVTDRWTPTSHRYVPYEVRNKLWPLDPSRAEDLVARTKALFDQIWTEKWMNTTGFVMKLAREGRREV